MEDELFTFSEPITLSWAPKSVECSLEPSMLPKNLLVMQSLLEGYRVSSLFLISNLVGAILVLPVMIITVLICYFEYKYYSFIPFLMYLALMYATSELHRQQITADSKKFTSKVIEVASDSPDLIYEIKNSINDPMGWHFRGGSNGPFIHLTVSNKTITKEETDIEKPRISEIGFEDEWCNISKMGNEGNEEILGAKVISIDDKKLPRTSEKLSK